jgi:RNA polymerase sigma-70 factor (ECF subfamily)
MVSAIIDDDTTSIRDQLPGLLPALRGFARFLARDPTAADDLVQETILRALRAEAQWIPGTSLRAWLFRILRNVHLELGRRGGVEKRVKGQLNPPASAPAAQPAQSEAAELARAMESLPEAQRVALVLVAAQGMSAAEAAEVCGVPEGTIKARVFRARAALAARYGGTPPG